MKDKLHYDTHTGTYHPAPDSEVAWTVNDTRGYIDAGPACDECGACECPATCENCDHASHGDDGADDCRCCDSHECIGLSFAYCCLDGRDSICEDCWEKDPPADIINCDCK